MPGKDGFLHISQLADKNAKLMSDVLSEGQSLRVKVTDIDRKTNK
jgi:polyribonucleotide nucleotidyltransferase